MPYYLVVIMTHPRHLRSLLLALALFVAAVGCSTGSPDPGAAGAGASAYSGRSVRPPSDYLRYRDVTVDHGLGSSESTDGTFPRTVRHALGTTTIKAEPHRVVVISGGQLDALLSLQVIPVGATNARDAELLPEYLDQAVPKLRDELDTITSVGQRTEPNLERIAALHPDLILGNKSGLADLYPQLSTIAPTVLTVGAPPRWRQDYLLLASALGLQHRAESVLDALSDQADQLAGSIGTPKPVISLVRIQADRIRAMGSQATAGMVVAEIGAPRPAVALADQVSSDVSAEEINAVDADVILAG